MRFLILKDNKITTQEWEKLAQEFTDLVKKNTGLTPTFYIEEKDYTNVPTETDQDGDLKPSVTYLKALTRGVHDKYSDYGVDSVVMLVHSDNWIFDGIWGTNFSNVYYQYHVHLCRFDKRNVANSLGTLYHEWMHSLDALIKTHTGKNINDYFKNTSCFADWDTTVCHGNKFHTCKNTPYSYIRWKENTDALVMIAPDLKEAYAKRKKMHFKPYLTVLQQAVDLLRSFSNRKNGVNPYNK